VSQSRQLAAIMFTDIVGYTAMMGDDEQKAFRLLRKNRELQKPIVEQYNGRWIKELGDGVMASFNTVSDAVNAAIKIQKACNAVKDFQLRIGIHLGEVVFENDDVFGDGVNIASRIQGIAEPGKIYVSEPVHHNVVNKKDISTSFVKTEKFKNVAKPVRIYQVEESSANNLPPEKYSKKSVTRKIREMPTRLLLIVALSTASIVFSLVFFFNKRNILIDSPSIQSIAVLPFINETGLADLEYLTDGITETLINNLSRLEKVSVKARSSVFHFKGKTIDLKKLGVELSVQAILNGRVAKRHDYIILNLELVDVKTGNQIWGEQYIRRTTDLVVLQSEIARDVTGKLKTTLSGEDKLKMSKNYTENAEAYQLYLKGRFHWNKRSASDLREAIEYFEQASIIDPNYALAYAGIADCYNFIAAFGIAAVPPKEAMPQAKAAAIKALEIDETLAEAYASLAFTNLYYDWDWQNGEKELKRAIQLNPNYIPAYQWYSHLLMAAGRTHEAITAAKTAVELDVLYLPSNLNLGWQLYYGGRYDEAVTQMQKTLELEPNFAQARWILGLILEQKKNFAEAIVEFQKAASLSENAPVYRAALGHCYAAWGKENEAKDILSNLIDQSTRMYVPPFWIAMIYVALNEKESAHEWLDRAYLERSGGIVWIKKEPKLESLRHDTKFEDLVRKVGFP
jgi:adenylate cyclase